MKLFIIILFLINSTLSAIDLHLPGSAIHNATSGSVLLFPSPTATYGNPACRNNGIETSATYLFSLEELPYYNFHAHYNLNNIGLHLGGSLLSHPLYLESCGILSVNYLFKNISIGSSLKLLYNQVEKYHEVFALMADVGIIWENVAISNSLSVKNVTQSSYFTEKLPVVYLWETAYKLTSQSKVAVGLEKETDFKFSFKIAGRYDLTNMFTILSSYQFEPNRIGVGIVFNLRNLLFSYSVRTHQYLPLNHYISIGYGL
ncbi:MAG: hypothetical protein K9N07_08290 [Candidatus Cloacimonetes bacterium]|nr:hypothetical protein [Candidatus Cloacimonadota bacterium]